MSRWRRELAWQGYLSAREQAAADWSAVARLAERVASEFLADSPYGGDLESLELAFTRATFKTRQAIARYREFLTETVTPPRRPS